MWVLVPVACKLTLGCCCSGSGGQAADVGHIVPRPNVTAMDCAPQEVREPATPEKKATSNSKPHSFALPHLIGDVVHTNMQVPSGNSLGTVPAKRPDNPESGSGSYCAQWQMKQVVMNSHGRRCHLFGKDTDSELSREQY